MNASIEWVSDDHRVAELVAQWRTQPFITIDTEFVRTSTFYPKVGLFQVADANGCYLVDPLALKDLGPLRTLLEDPDTIKVIHSGSEDAEIFQYFFKAHTQSVYDSQIGAAMLGQGMSIGYANLVMLELHIDVPKEETRSDWLQRPLSEAQCRYAALDVFYLYDIYQKQAARLAESNRHAWVMEDSNRMISAAMPSDVMDYYLKIRLAWQLRGEKLWLLQQLAAWRENHVAQVDIPRSRFIKDAVLAEIAQLRPTTLNQLHQVSDLHHRVVKQYGADILALSQQSVDIPRTQYPERIMGPFKKEASKVLHSLRAFLETICEQENIPVGLVSRKKYLEQLINSGLYSGTYSLPDYFCGWRRHLVGEPLLAHLHTLDRGSKDDSLA